MTKRRNAVPPSGRFYLINKAFRISLGAALFTSAINSLCSMADAMITGNLIGPDALAAVGLTVPVLAGLNCFSDLMIDGAVARASCDLGNQDVRGMRCRLSVGFFTGLIMIELAAGVLEAFLVPISSLLVRDSEIVRRGFVDYMRVAAASSVFITMIAPFPKTIRAVGNPRLAMQIMAIVSVGNVVCDLFFIRVLGLGIVGSAWGTVGGWALTVPYVIHCHRKQSAFRLVNPIPHIRKYLGENVGAGLPGVLGLALIGLMGFVANGSVSRVAGSRGLSIMSIGMQVVSVSGVAAFGLRKALQLVGGLLEGEKDAVGLRHVFRIVLSFTMLSVVAGTLIIIVVPGPILVLFGCRDQDVIAFGTNALRIFMLFLPPFYYTMTHSVIYQIRKYYRISVVCSALPVILVIVMAECASRFAPDGFWWAFPAGGLAGVGVHLVLAARAAARDRTAFPSLIPMEDEAASLTVACPYTQAGLQEMLERVEAFTDARLTERNLRNHVLLCAEEIGQNIITHAKAKKDGFFSLRLRIPGQICMTVRDDGIPFNPILKESGMSAASAPDSSDKPGLRIINTFCDEISYSYVCGQNMLQLKWGREA